MPGLITIRVAANIQIRCDATERDRLERIAVAQGISLSQLGRLLVVGFCDRAEAGQDVSQFLPPTHIIGLAAPPGRRDTQKKAKTGTSKAPAKRGRGRPRKYPRE